ncbi:hypothetical protein VV02_01950 [Luteipulveratus mongoliensis]|uniref:Uncharacterized protein n=1 Tax=Luteipulveratus mongoliensis TaxID=571913 RepID=A0A0K1JEA0_9MICO|nr:hypothetical protein VV02_01950 [Luteipulveratus mongoliensis]
MLPKSQGFRSRHARGRRIGFLWSIVSRSAMLRQNVFGLLLCGALAWTWKFITAIDIATTRRRYERTDQSCHGLTTLRVPDRRR